MIMKGLQRYLSVWKENRWCSRFVNVEGALSWQMTHEVEMKRSIFNTLFCLLTEFSEMKFPKRKSFFSLASQFTRSAFRRKSILHVLEEINKLEQWRDVIEHDYGHDKAWVGVQSRKGFFFVWISERFYEVKI